MRRSHWTWMMLALVPACAREGEAPDLNRSTASTDQAAALEALEAETRSDWTASFNATTGTASHLQGRFDGALAAGKSASDSALKFLSAHKQIFRMAAPEGELSVRRERADAIGMRHVRFAQHVGGVPVSGAEMFVHFRSDGSLSTIDSTYVPDLTTFNTTPAYDGEEALKLAIADFGSTRTNFGTGQFWKKPIVELVVLPTSTGAKLAYHVRLHVRSVNPSHMDYMIDAQTRVTLRKYENLQTAATPAMGTGKTSDNTTVNLQISENAGSYTLEDFTRTPNGIRTFNYGNQPNSTCSMDTATDGCLEQWLNAHPNGDMVTSTDKDTWDATGTNKGSAVEAHLYAGYVYDYYKSKFNRKGIDDMDMEIQSNVHFATSFANAFWDGIGMVYGDGDTLQLKLTTKGFDVIAHELTHGVTEHESALEYHDQPGALNESLSDIFGCFTEHVSFPDPVANWAIGEKIGGLLFGNGKIRDMADPTSVTLAGQPDNMSKYNTATDDNGGVHINSGIPNNAAYLMTMGGTNKTSKIAVAKGIGWEKSEQLWYRTATQYLGATSDFAAAAAATLSSATDLGFTDAEKATVECAWIAVGVITTPAACRVVADDGGVTTPDGGGTTTPDGGGGSVDAGVPDARPDTPVTRDAAPDTTTTVDAGRPTTDASTTDTTTTVDAGSSDAPTSSPDAGSAGSAGAGGGGGAGGTGGTSGGSAGSGGTTTTTGSCNCSVPGESTPSRSTTGFGGAVLALALAGMRRRTRKAS